MEERQTQQPSLPVEHHEDLEFFCPPESSPQLFSDSTEYYMSQAYKRSPPPLRAEFPDSESYEQEVTGTEGQTLVDAAVARNERALTLHFRDGPLEVMPGGLAPARSRSARPKPAPAQDDLFG